MKKFILFSLIGFIIFSCDSNENNSSKKELSYYQIQGEAQGTTYTIIFEGEEKYQYIKQEIDSILTAYDLQNSIYVENSLISMINNEPESQLDLSEFGDSEHFIKCFNVSKEIYNLSNGAFNPAVYPLVSFWGFYKQDYNYQPSLPTIDSLLTLINFSDSCYSLSGDLLYKQVKESRIDFNALAQGHSVDVIADYLFSLGKENFMIELGGEVRCKGQNMEGQNWKIGIDKPIDGINPGESEFQFIASMTDQSLATSGNYRKFYEIDGQKYAHTIDPKTGYPAKHNLLSVTVITPECIYADAFATTFMVLGLDSSIKFIEEHPELDVNAYFVYDDSGSYKTKMTAGFEEFILE